MNSTLRLLTLLGFAALSQQPSLNAQACNLCGTTASEWIEGITIDGVSGGFLSPPGGGAGGCADRTVFDTYIAVLKKGVSHSFTLTPGFSGAAQSEYWKMWIDLNHDGDLDDPGDLVYASSSGSTTTVSGSFFIPLSVNTGASRIRVAMRRGSPPPDCGNYTNGQVLTYNSAYIDECDISFTNACAREYIKQINISTINNATGCGASGYQDFTNISTTLNAGNAYPVQLTPGFLNAGQHPQRWLIWIDFNNDYDFDDPGEQVFDSGVTGSTTITSGTMNIPSSAQTATARMRIKMIPTDVNTVTLDPCDPVPSLWFWPDQYGEAEDYTVNIKGVTLEVQSGSAEDLVKDVLFGGNCFDLKNVTYSGQPDQIGSFTNGLSNVGFNTGLILATGGINIAPGPNDSDGASAGYGIPTPDADLMTLANGALYDMADIEFDFTPTQSPFTFEFVFASEEYCEYVNTQFNDVFGFFISGPGIAGTQNLAVVPSTATPVTINTVNHLVNSGLYTHNTPASGNNCGNIPPATGPAVSGLQYDGFTKKFTAVANVIPCATYHIKFKISDVGDGVWDSAVFLKGGSLNGGGSASIDWLVNGQTGVDVVTEGCSTVELLIDRLGSNTSLPLPVSFTIAGTATNGSDYGPMSTTYMIPAGTDQITIPVNIVNDLIPEGAQTVILTLNNACSCLNPQEILTILDFSVSVSATGSCGNSGTATVTATGSNPPYSYQWSNNQTTQTIVNLASGTYSVTVTDGNGCTGSASVNLSNGASPQASISNTQSACSGQNTGSATVSASGGVPPYTYLWNNGQTGQTATNIIAGIYTVTVTGSNSCTATAFATINQSATPLVAFTNFGSPLCNSQSNGSATISASGGVSPYTYQWSNGQTGATALNLAAGYYLVTVIGSNGCAAITDLFLGDPPALQIAAIVNGNVVTAQGSGGTGFLQYSIDGINFQSGNQFANLPCGTYTVTVRDANGCTETKQVTVNILSGSFQNSVIVCFGGSATITINASCGVPQYQYQLGNGQFQSSHVFNGVSAGTYSATIRDASGATVVLGPIVINQPSQFNAAVAVICNDATLTFSGGTPPYNFTSNPPDPDLQNLANGTYQVTATDGNGCIATTTFTVNVPPLGLSFSTGSVLCFGGNTGSITANGLDGCPPYTYSLGGSPFLPTNSFPNLAVGTYSLAVKDAKGNLSSVFVTVFQPALLGLSATVNSNIITANANGGTSPYQYTLNGGQVQGSGVFSNLSTGTYTVVSTDAHGCTSSVTNLVVTIGTVEPSEAWGLSVLPNPSTGLFELTLQNAPDVLRAEVFDLTGRLLQSLSLQPFEGHLTTMLELQDLPQGTYLLRLSDGKNWGGVRLSKLGGR